MLILLLQEGAKGPVHPQTKEPIIRAAERVAYLKQTLVENRSKIVIPTPALAEFLVGAGNVLDEYVDQFDSDSYFEIQPFSQRAAIEAAIATQDAIAARRASTGDEKTAVMENPRQVVKVDRQIVAISKVCGVAAIYTTDGDVIKHAEATGLVAVHVAELPLPPIDPQPRLFDADEQSDGPTESWNAKT